MKTATLEFNLAELNNLVDHYGRQIGSGTNYRIYCKALEAKNKLGAEVDTLRKAINDRDVSIMALQKKQSEDRAALKALES